MGGATSVLMALVVAMGALGGVGWQVQASRPAVQKHVVSGRLADAERGGDDVVALATAAVGTPLPPPCQVCVGRLLILDVRDPLRPRPRGETEPGTSPRQPGTVAGRYAYWVGVDGDLRLVDAGNPSEPVPLEYDTSVAMIDHYAYVAAGPAGLRIVDITAPADEMEVGYYATPGEARGVVARDDFAYVAVLEEAPRYGYD